jgi:hypothetical protein
MRFLKITLNPTDIRDLDAIINGLRTTIEREPIVDAEGDTYVQLYSDAELMEESFCLGLCFAELEEQGIDDPFFIEVIELEQEPVDVGRKVN